jgi:ribosomal protein S18 acetylase RimI-like enzyme
MPPIRLLFKPIDLDAHASICVSFRRDSFICSFGADTFFEEAGPDGVHYLDGLRARAETFRQGYVHAWRGHRIVGQIEMTILAESRIGYVNLFYLIAELRGAGVGAQLQHYAMGLLRQHGVRTARLSVSPTNAPALAHYRKHGWRDLGPPIGHDDLTLMERDVPPSPKRPASTASLF